MNYSSFRLLRLTLSSPCTVPENIFPAHCKPTHYPSISNGSLFLVVTIWIWFDVEVVEDCSCVDLCKIQMMSVVQNCNVANIALMVPIERAIIGGVVQKCHISWNSYFTTFPPATRKLSWDNLLARRTGSHWNTPPCLLFIKAGLSGSSTDLKLHRPLDRDINQVDP